MFLLQSGIPSLSLLGRPPLLFSLPAKPPSRGLGAGLLRSHSCLQLMGCHCSAQYQRQSWAAEQNHDFPVPLLQALPVSPPAPYSTASFSPRGLCAALLRIFILFFGIASPIFWISHPLLLHLHVHFTLRDIALLPEPRINHPKHPDSHFEIRQPSAFQSIAPFTCRQGQAETITYRNASPEQPSHLAPLHAAFSRLAAVFISDSLLEHRP